MKENSAKSIVTGMILKAILMILLVLLLFFAGRRAYAFGYQVFSQEAMSDPPGKKWRLRSQRICHLMRLPHF